MDDNTAGEDENVLQRTQLRYVSNLAKKLRVRGNWLELGADIGLLTQSLLKQSEINSVDVIEPNTAVHGRLRDSLNERGQILDDLSSAASNYYDGVAAIHVLDHITDLSTHLSSINSVLKPGGYVCFVTHNEKSILRKAISRRWPPFCLQHPQLFSPDSISDVLERQGFSVIAVERTANYFNLRHIATVAFAVFKIPKKLSVLVPSISVPLRLGNIATYAVKN
jgi:predicted TPR repeat methyltransferase